MSAELGSKIAATQEAVGSIIAKPKMTEKLLSRPPFRFIHDVITNIDKATGFIPGLLQGEELDSKALKDKASKIAFLTKMMSYLEVATGRQVPCKPQSIVAGLEPEATNEFLQIIAQVATSSSIDFAGVVRRTLGGDAGNADPEGKEQEAPSKESSRSAEPEGKAAETVAQDSRSRRGSTSSMASTGSVANFNLEGIDGHWETTARLFEGVISKPRLTEKLLSKPPFRFIHDIVTQTMKNNPGVLEGVFEPNQLDSKLVKERDDKIAFLEMLGAAVSQQLGSTSPARPSRIVAGYEPDRTNKLLQMLALVAKGAGEEQSNEGKAAELTPQQEAPREKQDDESKVDAPSAERHGSGDVDESRASEERSNEASRQQPEATAHESESKGGAEDNDDDEGRKPRPATARRRPPKLRNNVTETEQRPGGGHEDDASTRPVGVMVEGDGGDDDESDGDQDDIMNAIGVADESVSARRGSMGEDDDNVHGKLVRDILDEEKADGDGDGDGATSSIAVESSEAKGEDTATKGITLGTVGQGLRRGKGAKSAVDVDALRKAIQMLCQSTNPLGKCMDYVHEDMETMTKELEKWRSEYRAHCDAYEEAQRETSEELQPLRQKVREMEDSIKDQHSRIAAVKTSIAKNEQRIQEQMRWMITG